MERPICSSWPMGSAFILFGVHYCGLLFTTVDRLQSPPGRGSTSFFCSFNIGCSQCKVFVFFLQPVTHECGDCSQFLLHKHRHPSGKAAMRSSLAVSQSCKLHVSRAVQYAKSSHPRQRFHHNKSRVIEALYTFDC